MLTEEEAEVMLAEASLPFNLTMERLESELKWAKRRLLTLFAVALVALIAVSVYVLFR